MMCTLSEFWWIFLGIGVISALIVGSVPPEAWKAGLASGVIGFLCIVLLAIVGVAKNDLQCKEIKYQAVLDKRAGLVQECPDREKPGCQLKWIRYQKDSLGQYLRVLR